MAFVRLIPGKIYNGFRAFPGRPDGGEKIHKYQSDVVLRRAGAADIRVGGGFASSVVLRAAANVAIGEGRAHPGLQPLLVIMNESSQSWDGRVGGDPNLASYRTGEASVHHIGNDRHKPVVQLFDASPQYTDNEQPIIEKVLRHEFYHAHHHMHQVAKEKVTGQEKEAEQYAAKTAGYGAIKFPRMSGFELLKKWRSG